MDDQRICDCGNIAVSAANPGEQGLKPVPRPPTPTTGLVSAANPGEQGLKLQVICNLSIQRSGLSG